MSIAKSAGQKVWLRRVGLASVCAASAALMASACGSSSERRVVPSPSDGQAGEAGESASNGGAAGKGGGNGVSGGPIGEGGSKDGEGGAGDAGAGGSKNGEGGAPEAGASGAPSACPTGFGDCDDNPADCETPLDTLTSCGACDVTCTATNGAVACEDLSCTVNSCMTGFADCNDSGSDGCETAINTAANCGSCGNDCGTATCNVGGFCNGVEIGSANWIGRSLFAGDSVYRMFVPAPNYGLQGSYSIVRTPIDGSAEVILDAQSKPVGGMVADAANIYWGVGGTTAGVFKKGLTAPAAEAPTPVFTPASLPMQMVIQGGVLYFTGLDGKIYSRPMTAAPSEPGTAIVTAAEVAGTGTFNLHQPLAVTPTRLYWIVAGTTAGILRTAPIAGGAATDVAGASPRTWVPLAVSGEDVYWVQSTQSAFDGLYHYKAGETAVGLTFKAGLSGVAVNSGSLYFMETETKLYKAPLTGGVGTQIGLAASGSKDIIGFGPKRTYLASAWTRGNGFSLGKASILPK